MTVISDAYFDLIRTGNLREDPAQVDALRELDRVRQELLTAPAPKRGFFRRSKITDAPKGLYLWGGVGRGKSMLMDLLVEKIDVPKRRAHFHAFMQWVHEEMAKARAKGVDDAIAPVADTLSSEVRLLAFDEMQISDITDAMIVGRLFQKLFDAGVVVVTTSNRPPDDLYKNGLNRQLFLPFIDLLKEKMVIYHLRSETDHRQEVLSGSQTYFTPADAKARAHLDALWRDLTGDSHTSLTLKVKGRAVEIPRFNNGVARARFHDLCGVPLGAADYLALADVANVLILDDIPLLSRSNFNEAKRFVTLIDALYEGKVRLICSAAAAPDMLYVEGEGVFEFERTVSRLREMQGAEWGVS